MIEMVDLTDVLKPLGYIFYIGDNTYVAQKFGVKITIDVGNKEIPIKCSDSELIPQAMSCVLKVSYNAVFDDINFINARWNTEQCENAKILRDVISNITAGKKIIIEEKNRHTNMKTIAVDLEDIIMFSIYQPENLTLVKMDACCCDDEEAAIIVSKDITIYANIYQIGYDLFYRLKAIYFSNKYRKIDRLIESEYNIRLLKYMMNILYDILTGRNKSKDIIKEMISDDDITIYDIYQVSEVASWV